MERRRLVRVPASSANLGPGFDSFACALALHMELEVVETGRFAVRTDLKIARDHRNLAVRGFARLHPPDDFEFRISSDIPLSGGLGTSAAAYVAGLMAADHLFELDVDLLEHATALEGHPDNVAAALRGGFVVCADGTVARFEPTAGLEAVLVVPNKRVRTKQARAALPETVPLQDAAANVGYGALLVLGLIQGDWDMVAAGLHDRLHQPYRAGLYPRSAELVQKAAKLGALGATISGAGPTVLVWTHYEQTGGVVEALRREAGGWAQVIRAPFEPQGADVREL
ncbi:MAG: homoserine kinase [Solirubrobacteraceae bacterium]